MSFVDVEEALDEESFTTKEWYCSTTVRKQLKERADLRHAENDRAKGSNTNDLPKKDEINLDGEEGVNTLSVCWNPKTDTINFDNNIRSEFFTKGAVLSAISRLFDPLGLVQQSQSRQE